MKQMETDQKTKFDGMKKCAFDWIGKWPPVCAGFFHQPERPASLSEKDRK